MKYSRNQLNVIGKRLVSPDTDIIIYTEGLTMVEEWRKLHSEPLRRLMDAIAQILDDAGIKPAFFSQRLKRMDSIIGKLKRNPQMGLGGVQDIGGGRFVFDDINSLLLAKTVIEKTDIESFKLAKAPIDYVQQPKESGYRSIHFAYKYSSDNPDFNGAYLEIQIRTRLQHDWATAVETAELIANSHLKASQGDSNWLEFFKLVSAIFAKKENMPGGEKFGQLDTRSLCRKYYELNSTYQFLTQLKALVGAVKIANEQSFSKGYAVLAIQYDKKQSTFYHFADEKLDQANALYSKLESMLKPETGAVVLVSVTGMKELQEAYSSYFLDAGEFISALEKFNDSCIIQGYIK